MVAVFVILLIIIGTKVWDYMRVRNVDPNTDPFKDVMTHFCHTPSVILEDVCWLVTNILVLCLGIKISKAVENANHGLMLLERDSFYQKGSADTSVIKIRQNQSSRMLCLLYLMVSVSSFSLLLQIYKSFFFSHDCNPIYIPRELSSFINYVDLFLTRQLWIYVITQFFWPTKQHIEEEDIFENQLDKL